MDVVTHCIHAAIEQQVDGEHVFKKDTLTAILSADDLPEAMRQIEDYVRHLAEQIDAKNRGDKQDLVSQVKAYIEDNLGDPDLKLQSVAELFYVSPRSSQPSHEAGNRTILCDLFDEPADEKSRCLASGDGSKRIPDR